MVLHHTFDPECTVSDRSRAVNREKTLTVDCLFYEGKGLLQCRKNYEALCKVADWLIPEVSHGSCFYQFSYKGRTFKASLMHIEQAKPGGARKPIQSLIDVEYRVQIWAGDGILPPVTHTEK